MNEHISIGVDVGGSHISCVGINLVDQSVIEGSSTRVSINHNEKVDVVMEAWASAINATIDKLGQDIAGIGFAIPGPFDYHAGISKMDHKFPKLKDLHIPSTLTPKLAPGRTLEMRFLNDALAFAVGEAWMGAGKNADRVVAITLGTGFGSAYIDDGVPVIEREDVAPEGCFWHLPYKDGIADDFFSTRWFVNTYFKKTEKKLAGVKEIAERFQNDPIAQSTFQTFGDQLGTFLGPWLKKYNADILIMGGNIAHSLPLFEKAMKEALSQNEVDISIQLSGLLENAAMVGAARLFDPVFWERHRTAAQPL